MRLSPRRTGTAEAVLDTLMRQSPFLRRLLDGDFVWEQEGSTTVVEFNE
jgi:hypothetical protein